MTEVTIRGILHCSDCRYMQENEQEQYVCFFNPPVPFITTSIPTTEPVAEPRVPTSYVIYIRPVVLPTDFCHAAQPAPETVK